MKISLLVPTFRRSSNIEQFAISVNFTSLNPENVEILFGVHEEDYASINKIMELQSKLKIQVRKEIIQRYPDGKVHLSFLWNQLYEKSEGDILGFFGDDVLFKTLGWDTEVLEEFKKDKFILINTNDIHIQKGALATLFFTHKSVHQIFGMYLEPRLRRYYMDTYWDMVYRGAGKLIYRKDIITEHLHPEKFPEKTDEVFLNLENSGFKSQDGELISSPELKLDIQNKIDRLKINSRKKIISFSLWGNNPVYTLGAKENLKLQKLVYKDWTCRYYIDDLVPLDVIKFLQDNGAEIIKKERSEFSKGLFWRFEAGFDETIERFIVRDCDSRLNIREAGAIMEWEESGLPFHCMRDHKEHNIPVLGAMWGAVSNFLPNYKQLYNEFLNDIESQPVYKREKYFHTDQVFLNNVIWPKISNKALVHDDYKRFTGIEKSFKNKLSDNLFIGQQYGKDNQPLLVPI